MTDTRPPRPIRFIPCEAPEGPHRGQYDECGAAVLDTDEMRRKHRAWHANDVKVKNGMRSELAARNSEIAALKQLISDMRRDLNNIEIPEQVPPVELSDTGWSTADEPNPIPDLDDQPESTYLDDPQTDDSYLSTPSATYGQTDEDDFPPRTIDPVTGLPR